VYVPVITTCHYKGILPEYVMLCYSFPARYAVPWPRSGKVSWVDTRYHGPSCTMWAWAKSQANPYSSKKDTLPIVFLINKQAAPYRTCGGTCCPRVSTPKIWSLADLSTTCYDGINHLHHSNYCSNNSIDPHMAKPHLNGWKTTSLTPRHKPYLTSER
jgi:hypothetical protein